MGFASTGVSICCFVREQLLWLELGALEDVPLGQSWSHHSGSSLIHGQAWVSGEGPLHSCGCCATQVGWNEQIKERLNSLSVVLLLTAMPLPGTGVNKYRDTKQ